jgi:hypothetical protein
MKQPSGLCGDTVEGLLLGEQLGPRMGQRARACSTRRLHGLGPYHTLAQDGYASSPTGRERGALLAQDQTKAV